MGFREGSLWNSSCVCVKKDELCISARSFSTGILHWFKNRGRQSEMRRVRDGALEFVGIHHAGNTMPLSLMPKLFSDFQRTFKKFEAAFVE